MATDAKKHTTIAAGETPSRAALAAAILSVSDVIPVANATEATQVATAVAAAGQNLATAPVTVARADARGLHRIEYSYDGAVWLPASGVLTFASKSAADTWAAAHSSLLATGDLCRIGGAVYEWAGKWYPIGMRAVFNAATATNVPNNSPTAIDLDAPGDLPPDITWSESTKEITIGRAGRYRLMAGGRWQTNGTGYRVLQMQQNGNPLNGRSSIPAISGIEMMQNAFGIIDAAAGDKVNLVGIHTVGVAIEFRGATLTVESF